MQPIDVAAQYPIAVTPELERCRALRPDWYIQLKHASGIELGFMKPDLSNQPRFLRDAYNGKGIIITYDVEDAKREYSSNTGGGLKIVFSYTKEVWGPKHFIIEDPAGIFVDNRPADAVTGRCTGQPAEKDGHTPSTRRSARNARNPINALIGIVRIHAATIRRATPHFTNRAPLVTPTPMIEEEMICVVLTGIPAREAPMIVAAPAVSAANPWTGRSLVIP